MFLDIVNFTAWSSERDPGQVFLLLETIYHAFDEIAKRMGVFKVETIGDSYVAVCGLPKPRDHHAKVMALFARQCLKSMSRLTKALEVHLGPSTGDLSARIGLHSGPVTAGVLRGEKARFQLFGDTVNTAARLENTSLPNRIHCSRATRDLLVAAGKKEWIRERNNKISVKGKGVLETFWVVPNSTGSNSSMSTGGENDDDRDDDKEEFTREKNLRLVDWNVEVLYSQLEKVVASRKLKSSVQSSPAKMREIEQALLTETKDTIVIEEMTPILEMPGDICEERKENLVHIPPCVKEQLFLFVTTIKNLYCDVPFHNFEHASHVIMSAGKLMKRIITPDGIDYEQAGVDAKTKETIISKKIHEMTVSVCPAFCVVAWFVSLFLFGGQK